jgi:hypothetical protein
LPNKPKKAKSAKKTKIEEIKDDFETTKLEVYVKLLKKRASGEKLNRKETKLLKTLEESQNPDQNGKNDKITTQMGAAKYLGISQKQISNHVSRGNLKREPDGTFTQKELDRFAIERGGRKDVGKIRKYAEQQQKWDAEFRQARAEEKKLVVEQLRGKLASRKEIAAEWAGRVDAVTSGLEALVNRLPPLLVGKTRRQITKILQEEIQDLRKGYATVGKYCPEIKTNAKRKGLKP